MKAVKKDPAAVRLGRKGGKRRAEHPELKSLMQRASRLMHVKRGHKLPAGLTAEEYLTGQIADAEKCKSVSDSDCLQQSAVT